jgi:hypothetical protein
MNTKKVKVATCYCKIPIKKLIELVKMRFVDCVGTEELMAKMKTEREREYLATVALLDVKDSDLLEMIEGDSAVEPQHLFACREQAKKILKDFAIVIGAGNRTSDLESADGLR